MARRDYRPYKKAFPIVEFLLGATVGAIVVMIHNRRQGAYYSASGQGLAVSGKATHQPYAVPVAVTQLLPTGQTSVTGQYPPRTGPY